MVRNFIVNLDFLEKKKGVIQSLCTGTHSLPIVTAHFVGQTVKGVGVRVGGRCF